MARSIGALLKLSQWDAFKLDIVPVAERRF